MNISAFYGYRNKGEKMAYQSIYEKMKKMKKMDHQFDIYV